MNTNVIHQVVNIKEVIIICVHMILKSSIFFCHKCISEHLFWMSVTTDDIANRHFRLCGRVGHFYGTTLAGFSFPSLVKPIEINHREFLLRWKFCKFLAHTKICVRKLISINNNYKFLQNSIKTRPGRNKLFTELLYPI